MTWEVPQDEDEQDEQQRLDEQLREREVRRTLDHEEHGDAVTHRAHRHHGSQPVPGEDGPERRDRHRHHDPHLDRPVDCDEALRQVQVGQQEPAGDNQRRRHDDGEVHREGAGLDRTGHTIGSPDRRAQDEVEGPGSGRRDVDALLEALHAAPQRPHRCAASDGDRRQQERLVHAVPELEPRRGDKHVEGLGAADRDVRHQARRGAEEGGEHGEDRRRSDEAPARRHDRPALAWVGELVRSLVCEGTPDGADAVREGQDRPDDQQREHQLAGCAELGVDEGLVGGFLGDEAQQRRQTSHRPHRDQRDDEGRAQGPVQAREPAQVARAGLVVNDAHDHEQRGLVGGVRQQQDRTCQRRFLVAGTQQHDHEPELAGRPVSEEQLEIVLGDGPPATEQHGGEPDRDDRRTPEPDIGERRREPGDEVDACLHHRRRVQVRAHRCGGRHRTGQPEVERHLRRLGERAEQDQHQGDLDHGAARGFSEDGRHRPRAGLLGQEHEPAEHRQATRARGEQRPQRRGPGGRRTVVDPDEQVRRHRGRFPEQEDGQQVVADDEPEHRSREPHEQAREPTQLRTLAEVRRAIREHQDPDARDQQHHQQRELIDADRDLEAQIRRPSESFSNGLAVEDRPGLRCDPSEDRRRNRGQHEEPTPAERPHDGHREQGRDEV